MKLNNRTIVSSWMGDPMVSSWMGDPMVSSWMGDLMVSGCQDTIFFFFVTHNLLLMYLKILVPNFCVSMEMCSMRIDEICS